MNRPMARWGSLLFLMLMPWVYGCGLFQQLQVEAAGTSAQKPSNVAVYLSVQDGQEPITDLTEQSFTIYENEQPIDPSETKQVLLDRDLAAHHRVLLLVDMSAAKDEATRKQIARGVAGFIGTASKTQAVTVYAFDGRSEIELIGEYAKGATAPEDVPELAAFKGNDPSRNLHGAVMEAIKQLGARLMTQKKPIRVGTLVVLTAGLDRAGRSTAEQMQAAVDAGPYQYVAIGIGNDQAFDLGPLAKHGALWAPSLGGSGPTLEDAATRVETLMSKHYLFAYCSPARAGKRRLRIEVSRVDQEGAEHKGSVDVEFDSTGFGPGCDPSAPPRFGSTGASDAEPEGGKPAEEKKPAGKTDGGKGNGKGSGKGDGKKPDADGIVPPPDKPGYAPVPK